MRTREKLNCSLLPKVRAAGTFPAAGQGWWHSQALDTTQISRNVVSVRDATDVW